MSAPAMDLSEHDVTAGLPKIAWRVMSVFGGLAVISLALYIVGSIYGERISQVGHTTDETLIDIVIGNDLFVVPTNMVRHGEQRIGGVAPKIDLKIHWPTQSGYRRENAKAFSEADPSKMELVLLSISQRRSLLDMPERFAPIYRNAFTGEGIKQLSNGLFAANLSAEYGYINEKLIYSRPNATGIPAFIARCQMTKSVEDQLLLPCESDLFIGTSSELKIRFPASQISRWEAFSVELRALIERITVR